jgi:hypothetical protein
VLCPTLAGTTYIYDSSSRVQADPPRSAYFLGIGRTSSTLNNTTYEDIVTAIQPPTPPSPESPSRPVRAGRSKRDASPESVASVGQSSGVSAPVAKAKGRGSLRGTRGKKIVQELDEIEAE